MDGPAHSHSDPHSDDHAALHAALLLLAQAATLIQQVISSNPSAVDALSPDERQLVEAMASLQSGGDRPDHPEVSARASRHRGAPIETFDARQDERRRSDGVFAQFERVRDCFTKRQWDVVCPYYGEGLTDAQIAENLGKSERAVFDRRHRALRRKAQRERELLEERLRLTRKYADF